MSIKGREFIDEITKYIFISDKIEKSDIIFIPGNLYSEPAERAAQLYCEGLADYVLPSGKYSLKYNKFMGAVTNREKYNGNYKSEYEFMQDILIKNGVNKENILKEDTATWTKENAVFSRKVTDENNIKVKKAIICCKSYHVKRCLMFYSAVYPDCEFIMCPFDVDNINKYNWYKSDKGINEVMGELSRCGGQLKKAIKVFAEK